MKKIISLMLIAIMAVSVSAEAQVLSTKSRKITVTKDRKERKPIPWKWYAKGGIALMNAALADWKTYTTNLSDFDNVGYNFAGGFQWQIKETDWYWGAQIGLGMVGGSYARGYSIYLGPQGGYKLPLSFCNIDLHAGLNFEMVRSSDNLLPDHAFLVSPEFGVGFWFKRFLVDLSYRHGLRNDDLNSPELKYYNNLILSVGYQF